MSKLKKWELFSEQELQQLANESFSASQWIEKLGYKSLGGNITRVPQEILEKYPNINIQHFKGQGWNKGNDSYELLTHNYQGKKETIKKALLNHRGNKCECCGLENWLGQPIPLEVHHINGNNQDNDVDNLQLLCPNCHALTDNYRGRNINRQKITDEEFIQALQESENIYQALLKLNLSPKGANYSRAYKLIVENKIEHLK